MSGQAKTSVVVCAYTEKRWRVLREALAEAGAQTPDEVILVVDNNDELLRRARSELAGVTVIANHGPRGLSGARNSGVRAASGEIIVFLDDDASPRPGWLAELLEVFADPTVIGAGGSALPAWETAPPAWLPAEFYWVVGCSYRGLPEAVVEIRNPIGANMAFRREVLERIGGFSDGIGRVGRTPLGCEETELSIRAAAATGGRILLVPNAAVDHLVPDERTSWRYFQDRCWAEGISKAIVSRSVGAASALASERGYALRTLPSGVLRGLCDAVRGDRSGLARALAIAAGLLITAAGYLRGRVARSAPGSLTSGDPTAPPGSQPATLWCGELEISNASLPAEVLRTSSGAPFDAARLLVRVHGRPVGFVDVPLQAGVISPQAAFGAAQRALGDRIEKASLAARSGAPVDAAGRVTVCVCTRDRPERAVRCLEALLAVPGVAEVLIVDNAPADRATADVVAAAAARDRRVRYLLEPVPGLSNARNRGLSEARGDVIAFTDDDVRVDPGWAGAILDVLARRHDAACVTGLVASASLEHPAERFFDSRVHWSSSCESEIYELAAGARRSSLHPYTSGRFGTGANMAYRTEVLRELGGFDECLGAGSPTGGGEDLDIFVRTLLAGWAICYEPAALVWHEHRVDAADLERQMRSYGKGLAAYLCKYLLSRRCGPRLAMRALLGAVYFARLVGRSRTADADHELHALARSLRRAEWRGMLAGAPAYVRARRRQDPARRRAVAP